MAQFPGAIWRPVSAHGGAIGRILGVVIHVTAGEGDPYNEFANPNNQVSSHFGIGNGQGGMPDGEIEQYVDTANQSWAQAAGNSTYISVETEGEPGDALTPLQVAAFARLYVWLNQVHGIPFVVTDTVGAQGFITHGDGGNAWGGHFSCPGTLRASQRANIIALANPPVVTPPVVVPPPTSSPRGNLVLHTISIPTDANGNGFEITTIPWSTFEAIAIEGSDPAPTADNRYFGGTPHVQDRGGNVLASVVGFNPSSVCSVYILATQ